MNTMSLASRFLSKGQLDAFAREGWLHIERVFTPSDLQPMIDEVHAEVGRRADEQIALGKLSRDYREFGFERQLAKISAETRDVAHSIWNGQLDGQAVFDLIRNPKLVDIAESICGPELIAS